MTRRARLAAALCAGLLFVASSQAAKPAASGPRLPKGMASAFKAAGIPPQHLAIAVYPVAGERPLLAHNTIAAMNPASVMKLVTTFAGLETLGPAYTWKTEVLSETPIVNERLAGPLYLRGSGDPKLVMERFWLLLRELRGRGLRHLDGDLVLDRSAFAPPPHDPGAFDQEPLRTYNTGPDALLLNYNAVRLHLAPASEGQVRAWSEWPDPRLLVINRLRLSNGPCGDWRDRLQPKVSGTQVELNGTFAADCGDRVLNLSLFAGDTQVESLFRALWSELGGTFSGQVRSDTTPAGATRLALTESASLGELVRDINKFSNNVMARHLFLSLSPQPPATVEQSRAAVIDWLASHDIPSAGIVLDNGSGLSRHERISADQLRRLLQAAWADPVMPEFVASLPILGRDGTMRKRLADSPQAGRAHLKTGSLANVKSVAGYLLSQRGKRYVLVALVNDAQAAAAQPCFDRLIEALLATDRLPKQC